MIVLANFDVISQNVSTSFPTGGTWYDLMDETGSITISGSTSSINIPPGQFRIFGNQPSTLSTDDFDLSNSISIYPNPTNNSFSINASVSNLSIYDLTGKKVKEFIGEYSKGYSFDISNLTKSMYLVQIKNNSGAMKTTKLIKL